MYRCTECKEEFKEKPDYCTCGNDEFEEFMPAPENNGVPKLNATNFGRTIENDDELPVRKTDMTKIFSIGFFCLCLILAIIPWLIKTGKPVKTVQKPEKEVTKTIPDVEKIWNDTPPEAKTTASASELPPVTTATEQTVHKPLPTPPAAKQQHSDKQIAKPQTKPVQKTSTPAKPAQTSKPAPKTTTTSKPVAKPVSGQSSKPKLPQSVLNPSSNKQAAASAPQTTVDTAQTAGLTASQPAQTTQKPVQKQETPKMNRTEFLNYKGSIRSALLAKLNVASVQGSGDCAVEFSLDNSGKLINRNFIYKSQNKSVNDEVYLMLMRLPYYKTPPAHYNGEKIRLKFLFNNGYYEITFI